MKRLTRLLQQKIEAKEKILSIFVPAGFPELDVTRTLVPAIAEAGADLVEIGVPFSDPLADGPTIQAASKMALEKGVSLTKILRSVGQIRQKTDTPLILMSYCNPLLSYGLPKLVEDARLSGIDGFIIPDLIPEEYSNFESALDGADMSINFLIAPNTSQDRIRIVDRATRDFIYCVSVTGITGARNQLPSGLLDFLQAVARTASHPYLVGFGISHPDQAREIARYSHGVVIGSALVDIIARCSSESQMLLGAQRFVHEMKNAITGV